MQNAYKRCPACKGLTESERPFCAGCGCHFAPSVLSAPPPAASVFRSAAKSGFKFPPLSAVPTSARRALGTAAAILAVFALSYPSWKAAHTPPPIIPQPTDPYPFTPYDPQPDAYQPPMPQPDAYQPPMQTNDAGTYYAPVSADRGGRGGRGMRGDGGTPAQSGSGQAWAKYKSENPGERPLPDLPKSRRRRNPFGGN